MKVTNNHFKILIQQWGNFLRSNTQLPKDLIDSFLSEVKVSNLLLPTKRHGMEVSFPHIQTEDGLKFLPLFTDEDEMLKYSNEFNPIENEIDYYIETVNDLGFDGIAINSESEGLFIDTYMLNRISPYRVKPARQRYEGSELRKIALDASNIELVRFMDDDGNYNNYSDLVDIFVNSTLLNVVTSPQNLEGYSDDGVITKDDVDGFSLTKLDKGDEVFAVIFTDTDAIKRTLDRSNGNYYIQLANLFEFIKFVLMEDMGGIIINPGLNDYMIPRNVLLDIMERELVSNPQYPNSYDYAFEF